MKNYEGIFILNPTLAEDVIEKQNTAIQELIKKSEGSVVNVDKWGKKQLASKIKKFNEGVYFFMNFKAQPKSITTIEKALKLNESVIRAFIVEAN